MKTPALLNRLIARAGKLFTPATPPRASRTPYSRPEPLEDRVVLTTFLVTNLANAGAGSLRNAINKANAAPGPDIIQFQPGLTGTIGVSLAELNITDSLTITGPGSSLLTLNAHDAFRVLEIAPAKTVAISGLSIIHGLAPAGTGGGGILNKGLLTLANVTLDSNTVTGGSAHGGAIQNFGGAKLTAIGTKILNNSAIEGGGIFNESTATATLIRSIVTNNKGSASGDGAGLRNNGDMTIRSSILSDNVGTGTSFFGGALRNDGNLTILASTISGNLSQGRGGAIYNIGTLTVTNSTIVNNIAMASSGGGGIFNGTGALTILSSTITGNIDASNNASGAGGIALGGGTLALNNTVVARNFATGANTPDIRGAASGSGNFIGIGDASLTGITDGINSNQIGTVALPIDPKLGPLQNNGGPTPTRLPLTGSPLIGKGVNALIPASLLTDQRGQPRLHGATIDIGATEA